MQRPCLLLLIFTFFLLPLGAKGATLYLSPSSGEHRQGDTFITEVRLDTEGELINTCEVNLNFSSDSLGAVNVSDGGSVLSLWPKTPVFSNSEGALSFTGGIPGGFKGDGKLLSIIFEAVAPTFAEVNFKDSSRLLLNDGFGTPAGFAAQKAVFTILAGKLEIPRDAWKEELEKDDVPPESFEMEISKNPIVFEGKYFIVFSTVDNQTGIDHYEIKEGEGEWKRGESPYLLEDQSLKNKISVKAIDKAGNERISEILPQKSVYFWIVILIIILLCLAGLIRLIIKKLNDKR
ncbi:MAG: hypothetical protein ABIF89_02975 [bacterium]